MNWGVVTIFPELMDQALNVGVIGQARSRGLWQLQLINPRQFTTDVHQSVDDRPFGGGDGMLMLAEPLAKAVESFGPSHVIHLSPKGRPWTDARARQLAEQPRVLLVASRYAGVDQRWIDTFVDEEVSLGDFVISGGELAAACVIDSVLRHRPGVLGNEVSADAESFGGRFQLLEAPQFTRPREWRGQQVPPILAGGDHAKIEDFQFLTSLQLTLAVRPDLVKRALADQAPRLVDELRRIEKRRGRDAEFSNWNWSELRREISKLQGLCSADREGVNK